MCFHHTWFKYVNITQIPFPGLHLIASCTYILGFPGCSRSKELAATIGDTRDVGSIPELGRWHGNPLQYFCLENPMDRGAWWAIIHRAAKSRKKLSD